MTLSVLELELFTAELAGEAVNAISVVVRVSVVMLVILTGSWTTVTLETLTEG